MEYYLDEKKVEDHLQKENEPSILPERLKRFVYRGQSLLELGMGSGRDLEKLSQWYQVTGSDYSPHFLKRFQQENPQIDLIELDVRHLPRGPLYDALYSNKVLHLFSPEELILIFQSMYHLIAPGGIMLHSFLLGEKEEETEKGVEYYYTESLIEELLGPGFKILETDRYCDAEGEDLFYLIVRAQALPSHGPSS